MVEELAPLALAQLGGEERADVDRAVEVHVAGDVPRDALVDGDVPVGLRADEVRAPEAPDRERACEHERNQQERREEHAPADRVAPVSLRLDGDGGDSVDLVERVVLTGVFLRRG